MKNVSFSGLRSHTMQMLNLFLGLLWLAAGLVVLIAEWMGKPLVTFRFFGMSPGWIFLVLAMWNFVRWYSARAWRAEQQALRIAHEERMRQVRYRERPTEPDPTFDFSDRPAPDDQNSPGLPPTDRPPSNN